MGSWNQVSTLVWQMPQQLSHFLSSLTPRSLPVASVISAAARMSRSQRLGCHTRLCPSKWTTTTQGAAPLLEEAQELLTAGFCVLGDNDTVTGTTSKAKKTAFHPLVKRHDLLSPPYILVFQSANTSLCTAQARSSCCSRHAVTRVGPHP